MRYIDEIIVHCSATHPNWAHDKSLTWVFQEFSRWHAEWGARTCGYHFIINRKGEWMENPHRPVEQIGAHVKGHNERSIGICLLGGHGGAATDDPSDHFTQVQMIALRQLIGHLKDKYQTIREVSGHNEYAAKACPCFRVKDWYYVAPIADQVPVRKEKKSPLADWFDRLADWLAGKPS